MTSYLSEMEKLKMETQTQETTEKKGNGKAQAAGEKPPAQPKSLAGKLAAIMNEVGRVGKNGYNQHFKYAYVTESDLTDAIRPLLSKHSVGLSFSVEDVLDLTNNVTQVKIRYVLVNGEDSNDRLEMTCFGRGQDKADKGIYKAITGATKYWLYKTFLVSTGDDPENDADGQGNQGRQGNGNGNGQQYEQSQNQPSPEELAKRREDYARYEQDAMTMRTLTGANQLKRFMEENKAAIESNLYRVYYTRLAEELEDRFMSGGMKN